MVTWGANTVYNISSPAPFSGGSFGTPAPGPSLFGGAPSPAPASGFNFGSSNTTPPTSGRSSIFGSTAGSTPAPSTGFGGFGSTPASTPAGFGLFGGAPSSSSLFGAMSPTPAPFGGFGTPAPGLFGSTATQQQQQQQPQGPQVPAQAAMLAFLENKNAAETEKIKAKLSKLYNAYNGQLPPTEGKPSTFVSIVYNDLTQEHRQQMWLQGVAPGNQIMPLAPPKPPHVSEEEWNRAVVQNPDPMSYMPIPLVGADALHARVTWQQERAKQLAADAASVAQSHETVQFLYKQGRERLANLQRQHTNHRQRLLNVMRKVEVVRCMNQPLQQDEVKARNQLRELDQHVQHVRHLLAQLEPKARAVVGRRHANARNGSAELQNIDLPHDRETLNHVLNTHHEDLKKMTVNMSKDIRDVGLMKERVLRGR